MLGADIPVVVLCSTKSWSTNIWLESISDRHAMNSCKARDDMSSPAFTSFHFL